jgi:hypothetical protein
MVLVTVKIRNGNLVLPGENMHFIPYYLAMEVILHNLLCLLD